MADRREMVKPQGPGPGEGAGGVWDCPTLGPIPRLSAPDCLTCLMLDSLTGHLGPHPGPTLGKILNFLEFGSLLCKMSMVTVPSPRASVQGEALGPDCLGSNSEATTCQLCSLEEAA